MDIFGIEATRAEIAKQRTAQDEQDRILAERKYSGRIGLVEAIQKEIYPAFVFIRSAMEGVGFFLFPNGLISNAHILPKETMQDATISDYTGEKLELGVVLDESFTRPVAPNAPDLSVMKTVVVAS